MLVILHSLFFCHTTVATPNRYTMANEDSRPHLQAYSCIDDIRPEDFLVDKVSDTGTSTIG
jgi:hypothetical protein